MTDFKFKVEENVRKVGGSYQATGTIKAAFSADDGTARYVFRFDHPPGLLHIYNEGNLEKIDEIYPTAQPRARIELLKNNNCGVGLI